MKCVSSTLILIVWLFADGQSASAEVQPADILRELRALGDRWESLYSQGSGWRGQFRRQQFTVLERDADGETNVVPMPSLAILNVEMISKNEQRVLRTTSVHDDGWNSEVFGRNVDYYLNPQTLVIRDRDGTREVRGAKVRAGYDSRVDMHWGSIFRFDPNFVRRFGPYYELFESATWESFEPDANRLSVAEVVGTVDAAIRASRKGNSTTTVTVEIYMTRSHLTGRLLPLAYVTWINDVQNAAKYFHWDTAATELERPAKIATVFWSRGTAPPSKINGWTLQLEPASWRFGDQIEDHEVIPPEVARWLDNAASQPVRTDRTAASVPPEAGNSPNYLWMAMLGGAGLALLIWRVTKRS